MPLTSLRPWMRYIRSGRRVHSIVRAALIPTTTSSYTTKSPKRHGVRSNKHQSCEHVCDNGPVGMTHRDIARLYRNIALRGDVKPGYLGPEVRYNEIISEADRRNVAWRTNSSADVWEISWWPCRALNRDDAMRAVVLADVIGTRQAWRGDDPLAEVAVQLSTELGLTLREAIDLAEPAVDTDTRTDVHRSGWR